MSSARKLIERQAAAQGFTVTSMEFEAISAGPEMAGPDGGWMVYLQRGDEYADAMGYNAAQVVQWIRNIDRLDGTLTWQSDVFGCPEIACWKARGHRGEHVEDEAFARGREERNAAWERIRASRSVLPGEPEGETP